MYKSKEEMGGKPDAILSVRDCHAMKKLDPPTITGKLAQFADFGFVMTTSSAEFCLLAEDQVGYNIWLTALLTLIDPSACRIDPEFTPYASHYKPPKHKSRKGKGGAHASHSDSSDGSDADVLLLSPAAPAPGGDPRAGAGMATPSAAAAAGAGVGAGEVEGVGRSSTPTRPRAGSGRSSRSNASSGTKRGEPLSKKEEIRRLKAHLLEASDALSKLERHNRMLRQHEETLSVSIPMGSIQNEAAAARDGGLSRAMRGDSIMHEQAQGCACCAVQ